MDCLHSVVTYFDSPGTSFIVNKQDWVYTLQ